MWLHKEPALNNDETPPDLRKLSPVEAILQVVDGMSEAEVESLFLGLSRHPRVTQARRAAAFHPLPKDPPTDQGTIEEHVRWVQ